MANDNLPDQGTRVTVLWEDNPAGGVKSSRLDGQRCRKIILPSITAGSGTPAAGQTWLCQVERIVNPKSQRRGAIIVQPLEQQLSANFDGVWIDPKIRSELTAVAQSPDHNIFLKGMQGVGKTTIARALAAELGREFFRIEGAQIRKYTQFFGRPMQKAVNGQLCWVWEDSPLVKLIKLATKDPNRLYQAFIDEFSRIEPDAQAVLLPVIDGKDRQIQTSKPETLQVPGNIRWMAAANLGRGFNVRELDVALVDRWEVFEIDRMPYEFEIEHCLRSYPGCPREPLEKALTIVHKLIRILVPRMHIYRTVSVRRTETLAMLLSKGVEIEPALLRAVANHFDGWLADQRSECARVAQVIKEALAGKDIENS